MDKPKQSTKKYSLSEKNNRLLQAKPNATELEEIFVNFILECKKRGFKEGTIKTKSQRIKLVAKYGANILDPESVKETIAKLNWKDITKREAVRDFTSLYYFLQIEWDKPTYKAQDKMPFIPTEEELDTLISASSRLHAPLLKFLKESGARIGEASQIEWIDVDFERKIVAVNHPEKGSRARLYPISENVKQCLDNCHAQTIYSSDSKKKVLEKPLNKCGTAQQSKW